MEKPIKPNYTDVEIKEMNYKLDEYQKELYDVVSKNQFIQNNMSSKSKFVKGLKKCVYLLTDILKYLSLVVAFVYFTAEEFEEFSFFSLFLAAFSTFMVYVIVSPIILLLRYPFDLLFKKTEDEENKYNLEFQRNVTRKYEKYIDMEREFNAYDSELAKYEMYCKKLDKEYWYGLDGHKFEQEIANIFRKNGFNAKVSKIGADGGIDIVVTKDKKNMQFNVRHILVKYLKV